VEQQHVAGFHDDAIGRHDLFEGGAVDAPEFVAEVVDEVHQDAAPLYAVVGHVLEAEMTREAAVIPAVTRGVGLRSDEVDPGAVAVVEDRFFDAVAVGVELGARVGE
jgi:hypothetical protein